MYKARKYNPVILLLLFLGLTTCDNMAATSSPAVVVTPVLPTVQVASTIPATITGKPATVYPTPPLTVTPALATATVYPEIQPCKVADLDVIAGWQGATGSMAGSIRFTNRSSKRCIVWSRPEVQLRDEQDKPLEVGYSDFCRVCGELYPTIQAAAATQTVTAYFNAVLDLGPGQGALVMIIWSNWCKAKPVSFALRVTLPATKEQLSVPVLEPGGKQLTTQTPRCDVQTAPSTLSVGPFERVP